MFVPQERAKYHGLWKHVLSVRMTIIKPSSHLIFKFILGFLVSVEVSAVV